MSNEKKVALVTGGTTGIGYETAVAFGETGASIVIAGRRQEEGERALKALRDKGYDATFVQTDVSKAEDVNTLFNTIISLYGRLDYAFNNAGIDRPGSVIEGTEADFDATIGVNLKGVWLCLQQELRIMTRQGFGAIVSNASVLAKTTIPGYSVYGASKAGVEALTRTAAIESARTGVRVNAVAPAVIHTPLSEAAFGGPAVADHMGPIHPMGRIGQPREVADTVVWLCSDKASFITGQSLAIDGGLLSGSVPG